MGAPLGTARPIDVPGWPRREQFEHFRDRVPCSFAMTVELDVTRLVAALRGSRRRAYVAHVWALAAAVNRREEFRLTVTDDGRPAVWDEVHPLFTVFNPDRETFAGVWAPFDPSFAAFHEVAAGLLAEHRSATAYLPQGEPPADVFDVSSLPWTSFTGFTLLLDGRDAPLQPIVTLGRYVHRDDRVLMPLALQVHHAAADGFHAARLVADVQELVDDPSWL